MQNNKSKDVQCEMERYDSLQFRKGLHTVASNLKANRCYDPLDTSSTKIKLTFNFSSFQHNYSAHRYINYAVKILTALFAREHLKYNNITLDPRGNFSEQSEKW